MKSERYSGEREFRFKKYSKSPAMVCLNKRSLLKDSCKKRSNRDFRSRRPWERKRERGRFGYKGLPHISCVKGVRYDLYYLDVVNRVLAFSFLRHQSFALLPQIGAHTLAHGLQAIRHPAEQLVHAGQICTHKHEYYLYNIIKPLVSTSY